MSIHAGVQKAMAKQLGQASRVMFTRLRKDRILRLIKTTIIMLVTFQSLSIIFKLW